MSEAHWLWRLSSSAWLAAARHELDLAPGARRRRAVTHARRAAGMALNAVLVDLANGGDPDAEHRWGRSYLDHVRSVATGGAADVPAVHAARAAAVELLDIPLAGPELVQLTGGPDAAAQRAAELATQLVDACRRHVETRTPRRDGQNGTNGPNGPNVPNV